MDLVVDFAESSTTVEVPVAPRSSIEIHNSSNIVVFRECTNCEQMVWDRCPSLTFLLVYPFLNGGKWDHVPIPFCVVSMTKYDDQLKGSCHGTIDFLA